MENITLMASVNLGEPAPKLTETTAAKSRAINMEKRARIFLFLLFLWRLFSSAAVVMGTRRLLAK